MSQNLNHRPGGDSPPELVLPRVTNPDPAPPILCSFFPLSPNNMEPTSPTPITVNPTPSSPPTFAPSQTGNPRSFHQFLPPSHAVNESLLLNDPPIYSRPLHSQEATPASRPADSPRAQHITWDSEIIRYGLEPIAKQIMEAMRAEAAQISHPGLQICNPPAQIAQQTPKSDARNITKPVPSKVGKITSSKTAARKAASSKTKASKPVTSR